MSGQPQTFSYESMGTQWKIFIWDPLDSAVLGDIRREMIRQSQDFDQTYSRFIATSLVRDLEHKIGTFTVPRDLTAMLRLYQTYYELSGGKFTPLIGNTLRDLGYDEDYSLRVKDAVRTPPPFPETVRIIDDVTIKLKDRVLLDVGALGKGYFVDVLASYLRLRGLRRFLVDGSGDIAYEGDGVPIRAGLEHPNDPTKVIGVLELTKGGFCASGTNRRTWRGHHHIVDPSALRSPPSVIATWVHADRAAVADALATCLFLTEPERYRTAFPFEYCILGDDYVAKSSAGFAAELHTASQRKHD